MQNETFRDYIRFPIKLSIVRNTNFFLILIQYLNPLRNLNPLQRNQSSNKFNNLRS